MVNLFPVSDSILSLQGIYKRFKKQVVLDDISFDIKTNEILGIVGKSGSGKTTLFRIILGYYQPDKGKLFFREEDVNKHFQTLRLAIGYTTQEDSFYFKLSVIENMRYYAHLYNLPLRGTELDNYLTQILKKVNLHQSKETFGENLSGGMKRRLDFAISLIHNPDILIMDEPTAGLDPSLTKEFWKIINAVRDDGKTIIITSHVFSEIEKNCDRVIIIDQGKIKHTLSKDKLQSEGLYKYFSS